MTISPRPIRALRRTLAGAAVAALGLTTPAAAQGVLRIAMTASDIPTTTGMPNNGFEGMRFLGYTAFESFILWDLSSADALAGLKPGLAESWSQNPEDPTRWVFKIRPGVKFHDGTPFDAEAAAWNLARYYDNNSPQFETQGSAITRGRNPHVESWRAIDPLTFEIKTKRPLSYFPYLMPYMLFSSPAQFAKTGSWAEFAKAPAGTGPFKITDFKPRTSVELSRNDEYWDKSRLPKLDKIVLYPMPEATTRLSALRSGQVDWIEVPPPDAVPSIKAAGYEIVTNSYPHIWPWILNMAPDGSPLKDVRVRQAVNYCIDRDGLVGLLNGMAEPSYGYFNKADPLFGEPKNAYSFDLAKAKSLLAQAGYDAGKPATIKIMISTSGSGQMLPLPMNEFLQQSMKQCNFEVSFEVVEWGTMLVALRAAPTAPEAKGTDGLNVSSPTSDISQLARYLLGSNAAPAGSNWGHWINPEFDALIAKIETSTDPEAIAEDIKAAHALVVDEAPWAFIVHDLNSRAMSKKVKGFVSAQSWFQDLTPVHLAK